MKVKVLVITVSTAGYLIITLLSRSKLYFYDIREKMLKTGQNLSKIGHYLCKNVQLGCLNLLWIHGLNSGNFRIFYPGDFQSNLNSWVNSHDTRKGNAWKFVKTLHIKIFPFGQKWPSRIVTVKSALKFIQNDIDITYDLQNFRIENPLLNFCVGKTVCGKFPEVFVSIFQRFSGGFEY